MRTINKEIQVNQIVIATNTLYQDYHHLPNGQLRELQDTAGIRGDLALDLTGKALSLGLHIVICEGGSSRDFLSALERYKSRGLIVVTSNEKGRGPQRKTAFETAATLPKAQVIIYTQAEKKTIPDYAADISRPILEGKADIVVPSRNPELFEQYYPDYMRRSELRVNATYDRLMRQARIMTTDQSFDWFFGPVAFKNDPEIVGLFTATYGLNNLIRSRTKKVEPDPTKHSNGHYFPIIEALFRGKKVTSVEIPFEYPEEQRLNEMHPDNIDDFSNRRKLDASAYRLEAIHFLAFLKGNIESKISKV